MFDPYINFVSEIISAWRSGIKEIRIALILTLIFAILGLIIGTINKWTSLSVDIWGPIGFSLGITSFLILLGVLAYQRSRIHDLQKAKINEYERRIDENPKETKAAWELAQIKLESYLNRNLTQVRSIYWLTIVVMLVGFSLVGYGVFKVYEDSNSFQASIVATVSGILVNFIGASFLVIFRNTLSQAKEYVQILERINAVGMSLQVLDAIDDGSTELKNSTLAEISKQMLTMYSGKSPTQ